MTLRPVSRRAWRRQVAAYLVKQVDERGRARFVADTLEARREMLKVARLLPSDVIPEIFADPRHPTRTYMELYLVPLERECEPSFRVVYPDRATG
jgi:hypothetical protein